MQALTDELRGILNALTEADRGMRPDRTPFWHVQNGSRQAVLHPGFPAEGIPVYAGDIRTLERTGFIDVVERRGTRQFAFDLTPEAFTVFDEREISQEEPRRPLGFPVK